MQIYTYDKVKIKDGVFDELGDAKIDLAGKIGYVSRIGYRSDEFPIIVDIVNQETGQTEKELKFNCDELEVIS